MKVDNITSISKQRPITDGPPDVYQPLPLNLGHLRVLPHMYQGFFVVTRTSLNLLICQCSGSVDLRTSLGKLAVFTFYSSLVQKQGKWSTKKHLKLLEK